MCGDDVATASWLHEPSVTSLDAAAERGTPGGSLSYISLKFLLAGVPTTVARSFTSHIRSYNRRLADRPIRKDTCPNLHAVFKICVVADQAAEFTMALARTNA